ncbi:hypothetical protein B7463_g5609, partial [Scytalidium lignicola]
MGSKKRETVEEKMAKGLVTLYADDLAAPKLLPSIWATTPSQTKKARHSVKGDGCTSKPSDCSEKVISDPTLGSSVEKKENGPSFCDPLKEEKFSISNSSPSTPEPDLNTMDQVNDVSTTPESESLQNGSPQAQDANIDPGHVANDREATFDLRTEWIGTSPFCTDQCVEMQLNGDLDKLILYREAIVRDIASSPYDPIFYLELSRCDCKLGFPDIGVASAHKSLLLVQAGLNIFAEIIPPNSWRINILKCLEIRLCRPSIEMINDELQYLHISTYRQLLHGLIGCAAYWDGLLVVKEALTLFPDDAELLEIRRLLNELFKERHNELTQQGATDDIVALTRTGKIFQKPYPWLDKRLNYRTPELLKQINKSLASSPCELKPTVFTQHTNGSDITEGDIDGSKNPQDLDIGPLGLFATRDIKEGEIILEDHTVTGISDVPSSALRHCDACHASLIIPFIHPSKIIRPNCCKGVAYCSQSCHDTAMKKYHPILCGKEWFWLYFAANRRSSNSKGPEDKWRPIMFLRIIAIIITDMKLQAEKTGQAPHPLQHDLLARMAANYPSADKLVPDVDHDWQYFENIVAPTRILISLGVDIFAAKGIGPEIVQTIYWRLENNSNMSTVSLPIQRHRNLQVSIVKPGDRNQNDTLKMTIVNLNPYYLFFNHSCEPNVNWHGAPPNPFVNIKWLKGLGNNMIKPGSSTVICMAANDIKKGEELKISYIGDPKCKNNEHGRQGRKYWLKKWFENGCGCALCEKERREEDNFGNEE